MAETLLTYQSSTKQGVSLTMSAPDAVDGIEFYNRWAKDLLIIRSDAAGVVTMTIDVTATLDGLAIPDRVVSIPAGSTVVIGPLTSAYNQSDDYVRATFSAVTDITCALVRP